MQSELLNKFEIVVYKADSVQFICRKTRTFAVCHQASSREHAFHRYIGSRWRQMNAS